MARRLHPITHISEALISPTSGDILASGLDSTAPSRGPALRREPADRPVRLAADVIVDGIETETLEPRRGSRADVSFKIVAVDDYGLVLSQVGGSLLSELLEWNVDRSGEVFFGVLILWERIEELRALPDQSPNVISSKITMGQ